MLLRHPHHHEEHRKKNVAPPVTPEPEPQPELNAEVEDFSLEMLVDNDLPGNGTSGHDIQEITQNVPSAGLPSTQEPQSPDTLPRRSQREKRPRETLAYDSLGQPTRHVLGPHTDSVFVGTLAPVYGQCSVPWLLPQMFGAHLAYPTFAPTGYF